MRYPPGRKEETRRHILDAAGRVFRRQGFGAGVDAVMAEAGLTPGGFYAHFESKEALFAEVLAGSLRSARLLRGEGVEAAAGPGLVRKVVGEYLSPGHRGAVERGCVMPPLLSELPRRGEEARREFQKTLGEFAAALGRHLTADDGTEADDRALALIALLVGGMTLSRAVADEPLADRILAACRGLAEAALGDADGPPATSDERRPETSPTPPPKAKGRKR
jgi:TetR/AcrR family transcriptional repressor of nem operon